MLARRHRRPAAATTLVRLTLAVTTLVASGVASAAQAWTPRTHERIAAEAARLAPPDLHRQLARNRPAYYLGAVETDAVDPSAERNGDTGAGLEGAARQAIDEAILAIRLHRPFNEIAYRLGKVARRVAAAHDPLAAADGDPLEGRYRADFRDYLESVEPRIGLVFYGFRSRDVPDEPPPLVDEALARGRRLYPLVGREYRRVAFASGRQAFDDRSTAYAVASLALSHAVSDVAEALRYIWLAAGGIDTRPRVPLRGEGILRIPRETPPQDRTLLRSP